MNRLGSWSSQGALPVRDFEAASEPFKEYNLHTLYQRFILEEEGSGEELTSFREYLKKKSPLCGIFELHPIELDIFEVLLSEYHPEYRLICAVNRLAKSLYNDIAKRVGIEIQGSCPRSCISRNSTPLKSWSLDEASDVSQNFPILVVSSHMEKRGALDRAVLNMEITCRFFLDQTDFLIDALKEEVLNRYRLEYGTKKLNSEMLRGWILNAISLAYLGPEHAIAIASQALKEFKKNKSSFHIQTILLAEKLLRHFRPKVSYPIFNIIKEFPIKGKKFLHWNRCLDCILATLVGDFFDEIGGKSVMEVVGWDEFDENCLEDPDEIHGKYWVAKCIHKYRKRIASGSPLRSSDA